MDALGQEGVIEILELVFESQQPLTSRDLGILDHARDLVLRLHGLMHEGLLRDTEHAHDLLEREVDERGCYTAAHGDHERRHVDEHPEPSAHVNGGKHQDGTGSSTY